MKKGFGLASVLLLGLLAISGCATGRNYQTDIDALNARISTLQGQLAAKDDEINRLQGQQTQQQAALTQAEADKQMLSEKLDAALSQAASRASKKTLMRSEESDLK